LNAKVDDLMVSRVISTQPHKTVGHAKKLMQTNKVNVIPVVGPEAEPLGIVSSSDLLTADSDESPVSQVMTEKVYTVPRYDGVHVAARIMRNHHIHHLVVTHEGKVTGILSSFDLIKLVEDHRFVMKNAPSTPKKKGGGKG